ncbi:kielin/chordin-like protein, partial [Actinia tenebrosa]|uniref:Kielin/chordin-like protein n=1 Tax=Actinia tenebrosa TaxID=6105 RepID=A0A6P8I6P5_ACTTE
HHGVEYKEGKKIPTENPCLKCKCRKGKVQCEQAKKCPKLDGCPAPVTDPEECCPRCVCQDTEGNTYQRFQNWTFKKGETCYECECKKNSIAKCKEQKCKEKSCPKGFDGVNMTGFCCPVCTKVMPTKRPPPRKFKNWKELDKYITDHGSATP